jgi:hypothetical protein
MIKSIVCLVGLIVGFQAAVGEAEPVRSVADPGALKAEPRKVLAPAVPMSSDTLRLMMISGTSKRYLASISGAIFAEGETHTLSLQGKKVSVQCLEIRPQSVLVKVEGEANSRELTIGKVSDEFKTQSGEVVFEEHNFAIRVPPRWEWVTPPSPEVVAAARTRDGRAFLIAVDTIPARLRIWRGASQELSAGIKAEMIKSGVKIGSEGEVKVNDVLFRSISGSHPRGASVMTYSAVAGLKGYALSIAFDRGDVAADPELQSIVNSFRLLRPETTPPVWQWESVMGNAICTFVFKMSRAILVIAGIGWLGHRIFAR